MKLLFISSVLAVATSIANAYDVNGAVSSSVGSFSEQADAIQKGKEKKVYPQFIISHDASDKKMSSEDKEDSEDDTNKSGSGDTKKDIYADSRFEGICKHDDPDGSSNKAFCDQLCSMCEKGNECCIAKHLGCDVNGWDMNDQSSFLRGEGKAGIQTGNACWELFCSSGPGV